MIEFESFLRYYRDVKSVSEHTLRAYRSDLELFGQFLNDEGISRPTQVDHSAITKYIDRMKGVSSSRSGEAGLSDATIARCLAAVSSFLDFLRVTKNPKLRNPLEDSHGAGSEQSAQARRRRRSRKAVNRHHCSAGSSAGTALPRVGATSV